jgi:hypothetical protein
MQFSSPETPFSIIAVSAPLVAKLGSSSKAYSSIDHVACKYVYFSSKGSEEQVQVLIKEAADMKPKCKSVRYEILCKQNLQQIIQ